MKKVIGVLFCVLLAFAIFLIPIISSANNGESLNEEVKSACDISVDRISLLTDENCFSPNASFTLKFEVITEIDLYSYEGGEVYAKHFL